MRNPAYPFIDLIESPLSDIFFFFCLNFENMDDILGVENTKGKPPQSCFEIRMLWPSQNFLLYNYSTLI